MEKMFKMKLKNIVLLIVLAIVLITLSILLPDKFLTLENFQSMAFQIPGFGFLVLAMMLVLISGGIDLSIISIMNLSAIIAAIILTKLITPETTGINTIFVVIFAILAVIITSLLLGLINGLLISYVNITPMLATLGTMLVYAGLCLIISGGSPISGLPDIFNSIGSGIVFHIPVPLIIFFITFIILVLMLNKTAFGVSLYLLGSNRIVSMFTGINNRAVLIKTYMLSGFLSGVSAIILLARANSIKPGYGESYLLQTIIVVVLGGVSIAGGSGSISGVLTALVIIRMIESGFNILGINVFIKNIIFGVLLIVIMIINYYLSEKELQFRKVLKSN